MLCNRDSRYLASKALSRNGYGKVSCETYEGYEYDECNTTRDVMLRNEISVNDLSRLRLPKNILVAWLLLTTSILATTAARSAWFERLIPQGETYTVREIDRDLAFVIDGFIYDARTSCFLAVGDRVIFFEGRHGIDYRATIYDLDSRERCNLLLRGRLYE
ncbi:hypothetical protein QL886_07085 [Psychrobacter sp. APC 3281]|uniref:hypothetical protein n=1 Tax=Psychrobacter sp. APC 3281 TaxID=3035190 RepID=UPI0025B38AAA|nr:hypothetical protein [Psychrobacter sp. APC 3281]MDN3447396.1 hypothetical protein [Psychrobacter sp. APC 3281]